MPFTVHCLVMKGLPVSREHYPKSGSELENNWVPMTLEVDAP